MKKHLKIIVRLIIALNLSCVTFAKPTEIDYLIPQDFTGGVIIVFNQPDGITPETSNDGTVIYRIPKDGLIKVKAPLKNVPYEFKYYFVDEKGNRTPIEYLYPGHYVRNPGDTVSKSFDTISDDETNNKIFAMIHTTTNFGSQNDKIYFHNFIVGKPKDYQLLYLKTSDKIDEFIARFSKVKVATQ